MSSQDHFPPAASVDEDDPFAGGMAYRPRRSDATAPDHGHHGAADPAPPDDPPPSRRDAGGDGDGEGRRRGTRSAGGGTRVERRRRSRRHRGRAHRKSVLALAGVVAVIGAAIGVGGGFGMVWLMRDSPFAAVASPEEQAARSEFMAACVKTLPSIDCGCLYDDARPALVPEYRAAVLRLIDERRDLPVRLQRIRSEKLLGPELAKTVWEAAYRCSDG